MLETRGDLPVNSGYKGIIDVGQEDACMLLGLVHFFHLHHRATRNIPKSAVAIANFPRPGDFGSSWVSWLSGARMGLVSSTDMVPQLISMINPNEKNEEFRWEILREYIYEVLRTE